MESLSENGSLKQLNIKCSIDNKILDSMSTITTFGSVVIETGPQRAVLKTEKSKQAQIVSVVEPPTLTSINDIKLTLYSNIKIPNGISNRSRGCVICPNGKMLFNPFCTFGININDTYTTRCGHCYSTIIDQGHVQRII
jgi:hypothetical protein